MVSRVLHEHPLHIIRGNRKETFAVVVDEVGNVVRGVEVGTERCVGGGYHDVGVAFAACKESGLCDGVRQAAEVLLVVLAAILPDHDLWASAVIGIIPVNFVEERFVGLEEMLVHKIGLHSVKTVVDDDVHVRIPGFYRVVEQFVPFIISFAVGFPEAVFIAYFDVFEIVWSRMSVAGADGAPPRVSSSVAILYQVEQVVYQGLHLVKRGPEIPVIDSCADAVHRFRSEILAHPEHLVQAEALAVAVMPVLYILARPFIHRSDGLFPVPSVLDGAGLHVAASGEADKFRVEDVYQFSEVFAETVRTVLESRRHEADEVDLYDPFAVSVDDEPVVPGRLTYPFRGQVEGEFLPFSGEAYGLGLGPDFAVIAFETYCQGAFETVPVPFKDWIPACIERSPVGSVVLKPYSPVSRICHSGFGISVPADFPPCAVPLGIVDHGSLIVRLGIHRPGEVTTVHGLRGMGSNENPAVDGIVVFERSVPQEFGVKASVDAVVDFLEEHPVVEGGADLMSGTVGLYGDGLCGKGRCRHYCQDAGCQERMFAHFCQLNCK